MNERADDLARQGTAPFLPGKRKAKGWGEGVALKSGQLIFLSDVGALLDVLVQRSRVGVGVDLLDNSLDAREYMLR
jgi:hypothetical protein